MLELILAATGVVYIHTGDPSLPPRATQNGRASVEFAGSNSVFTQNTMRHSERKATTHCARDVSSGLLVFVTCLRGQRFEDRLYSNHLTHCKNEADVQELLESGYEAALLTTTTNTH